MKAMTMLQFKQQAAVLTEQAQRELSGCLIRLGQQSVQWRRELSCRTLAELKRQMAGP
jgi:hypothetical protein